MRHLGGQTKTVAIVIPCHNEAAGIAAVIKKLPRQELAARSFDLKVYVVDNNSSDRTAQLARQAGAIVIHESRQGKGYALRAGFRAVSKDVDYVVMIDGDDTYSPEEILRMIEPLHSDFCDVVVGSRLGGSIQGSAMTTLNLIGNWLFTNLVRTVYRANVTDVLTGYFAWKKQALDGLYPHLRSEGFAIEMEMVTKMARLGQRLTSVPISYHPRAGESNLHPLRDGSRILKMFLRNLGWNATRKPLAAPLNPHKIVGQSHLDAKSVFFSRSGRKRTGGTPEEHRRENADLAPNAIAPHKIVFVSDGIYPYMKGGKEKRLYEISRRLANMGYDVHIYTMHWWKNPQKSRTESGVHLHALCKRYDMYRGDRRAIKEGVVFGVACLKLLRVSFDVLDVDHMPFFPILSSWLVCKLRGRRFYGTWHEALSYQEWVNYMGPGAIMASLIERLSIRLPHTITTSSAHTKELLASVHKRVKRVGLVAPGIDIGLISRVEPAKTVCDVLYAGRLVKDKNIDQLIRAVGILAVPDPAVKCLIIGQGPEKTYLRRLVKSLGLEQNVTIRAPFAKATDVYANMKAAKAFCIPSTREGFSIVTLEALGCGTPVVTVNSPANAARHLVQEGATGSIVPCTPEDLAAALTFWMTVPEKPDTATQVAEYDWSRLVKKQIEVYTS